MTDRYYTDHPITGPKARLAGAEAHHLLHVMRAKPGEAIVLFDGSGAEFIARVEAAGRNEVELTVLERHEVDRELPRPLTLGVSLPKGDRQRWLVEKAVELGLSRLVPLVTARSVAQPVDKALERLRRVVVEASKQCGRNRLMEIGNPLDWRRFVHDTQTERWLAHPAHDRAIPIASFLRNLPSGDVSLAVGPEGGFTDDEIAIAVASGWQIVDLGPRILRVETAALVLLGLAGLSR